MSSVSASFLLALAGMPGPTGYPVEDVWAEYIAFCASDDAPSLGWSEYLPEPETPLAFLADGGSWRMPELGMQPAKVYRTEISGRTLYGFKRKLGSSEKAVTHCQAYDFEMTEKLVANEWANVVGPFDHADEREFTQRFRFGESEDTNEINGALELHLRGYFPPLDSTGFVGLQLLTYFKES